MDQGAGQRPEHLAAESGGVDQQKVVALTPEVVDGDTHPVWRRAAIQAPAGVVLDGRHSIDGSRRDRRFRRPTEPGSTGQAA